MRLLSARDLRFKEFNDDRIPKTVENANIWVDTCCIDKSSSAELQESINSMYRWYLESDVCYAYLSDVSISTNYAGHRGSASSKVQRAPRDLIFFDEDWNMCGDRVELQDAIQAATGIDSTSLIKASHKDGTYLRFIRLGRLFSWAANRQTTRYEDQAYSLLGIFDVNMPLLYGEIDKAFYRLQEEIIKVNEDVSMLAWNYTEADDGFAPNGLAKSPSQFQNYQNLATKDNTRVPKETGDPWFFLSYFGNYTFVVELVARNDSKRRYVVIVDYWSDGTTITKYMTVTVVRRRWHINLAYALELAQRRQTRQDSKSCKLPDEYGNGIPAGEIIFISHLTILWISEAENKLNKEISRPRKNPEIRTLGSIKPLRNIENSNLNSKLSELKIMRPRIPPYVPERRVLRPTPVAFTLSGSTSILFISYGREFTDAGEP
ncbi:hypothetical protein FPSE_09988 [Fusarium pseudograminearum CS3096]|uniref:Heterokaryon incompatibility domain-containing protein n=1 Tax=Fusarium pseudograminearum (strain CS3096) TaxID=1028729 RepID=K3UE66_FUSPC|nr:hypothetical protein FPSE_09988 [Fusarium pseudograminearum CS3096]EKJ69831.1 hypothetical protein FPSE_09988 [Fusarium pseudograminearum CS3096]